LNSGDYGTSHAARCLHLQWIREEFIPCARLLRRRQGRACLEVALMADELCEAGVDAATVEDLCKRIVSRSQSILGACADPDCSASTPLLLLPLLTLAGKVDRSVFRSGLPNRPDVSASTPILFRPLYMSRKGLHATVSMLQTIISWLPGVMHFSELQGVLCSNCIQEYVFL